MHTAKEKELIEFSVTCLLKALLKRPLLNYIVMHTQKKESLGHDDDGKEIKTHYLNCELNKYFNHSAGNCISLIQCKEDKEPKIRIRVQDLVSSLMLSYGQRDYDTAKNAEMIDESVFYTTIEIKGVLNNFKVEYDRPTCWLTITGKELTNQWNKMLEIKMFDDFSKGGAN